jgi:micrococcal nuclease
MEAADTLTLSVKDDSRQVKLAGIAAPKPDDDCLFDESVAAVKALIASDGALEVAPVGESDAPVEEVVVTVDNGLDVAVELIRRGVAVSLIPQEERRTEVVEAQDEALAEQVGLFDPAIACTVPGLARKVEQALTEAVDAGATASGAQAAAASEDLAAALEDADAFYAWIDDASSDLRVVGYPASALTSLVDGVRRLASEAERAQAKAAAAARKHAAAVREKRRLEARLRAEAAERAAAAEKAQADARARAAASAPRVKPRSSGGSAGGGSGGGYTGPRCYAPGGKTWRPC